MRNYDIIPDPAIAANLTKAMAIVEAAPDDSFDLAAYVDSVHDEHGHICGTVACSAGWLAVSPDFKNYHGLTFDEDASDFWKQHEIARSLANNEELFGESCWEMLFSPVGSSSLDNEIYCETGIDISDKKLAIERFKLRIKDFEP